MSARASQANDVALVDFRSPRADGAAAARAHGMTAPIAAGTLPAVTAKQDSKAAARCPLLANTRSHAGAGASAAPTSLRAARCGSSERSPASTPRDRKGVSAGARG